MRKGNIVCFVAAFAMASIPQAILAQSITAPNNQGIITQNQNGNNLLYIAPKRLQFTEELGNEILGKLDGSKVVILETIGGNADQIVGNEIQAFLEHHGVSVQRNAIGMIAPPPDGKLSLKRSGDKYILLVAPSAS